MTRSRRAGLPRDHGRRPMYARLLGLRHLTPSGFLCFVFLEGSVALGVLLALAELVSWWGVLVLPLTVAAMVKLNDVLAGAVGRPTAPASPVSPVSPVSSVSTATVGSSALAVRSAATEGWAASRPGTGGNPFAADPWADLPRGQRFNAPALRTAIAPLLPREAGWPRRAGDDVVPGEAGTVDLRRSDSLGWIPAPSSGAEADAQAPADLAPDSSWADELDTRLQRERQPATRHYD
jgi:hypothetical protein